MRFKYGSWPYPSDLPVYLYWVRSPMQADTETKQWRSKVLFIGENGKPHERLVPWGCLPELKLGSIYLNGGISNFSSAGENRCFEFSGGATINKLSAASIHTPWINRVRDHKPQFLYEQCIEIREGTTALIIPSLEIVRSFFGINKLMSNLILEPGGLTKICSSELERGCVRMNFNREIPVDILNQILVTRIATICHHPDWWNSWQQIWNRSTKNVSGPIVYSQLFCCPPIVRDSRWAVRGIPCEGNTFLVLEVLGFRTKTKLPFTKVTYSHPNLAYPLRVKEPTTSKRVANGSEINSTSNEGEIDTTKAPQKMTTPRRGAVVVTTMEFGNWVRVVKQYTEGKSKTEKSNSPGHIFPGAASELKEACPVSMNDEGGTGQVQAAEFKPIQTLEQIPLGLRAFIVVVKEIASAKTSCTIEPFPDDSPLARLGDVQRSFALAHVVGRGYILEIDSSDGHSVSTIVFSTQKANSGLETAKTLLQMCLGKGGHWSSDALNTMKEISNYALVKHRLLEPVHWGFRLYFKLCMLGRKNAIPAQRS